MDIKWIIKDQLTNNMVLLNEKENWIKSNNQRIKLLLNIKRYMRKVKLQNNNLYY